MAARRLKRRDKTHTIRSDSSISKRRHESNVNGGINVPHFDLFLFDCGAEKLRLFAARAHERRKRQTKDCRLVLSSNRLDKTIFTYLRWNSMSPVLGSIYCFCFTASINQLDWNKWKTRRPFQQFDSIRLWINLKNWWAVTAVFGWNNWSHSNCDDWNANIEWHWLCLFRVLTQEHSSHLLPIISLH